MPYSLLAVKGYMPETQRADVMTRNAAGWKERAEAAKAKLREAEKERDEWRLLAERRADQILSDRNDAALVQKEGK